MSSDKQDSSGPINSVEIDKNRLVYIVVGPQCSLFVPHSVSRDELIDTLQAALEEVLNNTHNVITIPRGDYLS